MGNWCDSYPYLKVYQKRKTTHSKISDSTIFFFKSHVLSKKTLLRPFFFQIQSLKIPYPYPTVTYNNNSIKNKNHPYRMKKNTEKNITKQNNPHLYRIKKKMWKRNIKENLIFRISDFERKLKAMF